MSALFRIVQRIASRQGPDVVVVTAAKTLTYDQATRWSIVHNTGAAAAVTVSLPAAVVGMRVTAVVKAAQELRLDPNGTETIALPATGVQQAAGKYITADALSESITLACLVTGTWDPIGATDGTWTVEA